ncbi:MAG: hypothetical protein JBO36_05020 [Candidatus Thiodiazotropha taylori]|nr:hypothetical protein [Candidatus Thiodiazotropha taylori]
MGGAIRFRKGGSKVALIDIFLLLAFALLVLGIANKSNSPVPKARVLSISQDERHLRFILFENQFIGLDQLDKKIQMAGQPRPSLEKVKNCIETKLYGGTPTSFQYIDEANSVHGVTLTNHGSGSSKNISIMIDLNELPSPVYLGFEACCEPHQNFKSIHPIQGQLYDYQLSDPFNAIEVWYDKNQNINNCNFNSSMSNVIKTITGPKTLSVNDTINTDCSIGLLVIK